MTATILDFKTREAYNAEKWKDKLSPELATPDALPLTALEVYSKIWLETLKSLQGIVTVYKTTGQWNEEVDRRMGKVLRDLQAIAMSLAQYDPFEHLPKSTEPEGPAHA